MDCLRPKQTILEAEGEAAKSKNMQVTCPFKICLIVHSL